MPLIGIHKQINLLTCSARSTNNKHFKILSKCSDLYVVAVVWLLLDIWLFVSFFLLYNFESYHERNLWIVVSIILDILELQTCLLFPVLHIPSLFSESDNFPSCRCLFPIFWYFRYFTLLSLFFSPWFFRTSYQHRFKVALYAAQFHKTKPLFVCFESHDSIPSYEIHIYCNESGQVIDILQMNIVYIQLLLLVWHITSNISNQYF